MMQNSCCMQTNSYEKGNYLLTPSENKAISLSVRLSWITQHGLCFRCCRYALEIEEYFDPSVLTRPHLINLFLIFITKIERNRKHMERKKKLTNKLEINKQSLQITECIITLCSNLLSLYIS